MNVDMLMCCVCIMHGVQESVCASVCGKVFIQEQMQFYVIYLEAGGELWCLSLIGLPLFSSNGIVILLVL